MRLKFKFVKLNIVRKGRGTESGTVPPKRYFPGLAVRLFPGLGLRIDLVTWTSRTLGQGQAGSGVGRVRQGRGQAGWSGTADQRVRGSGTADQRVRGSEGPGLRIRGSGGVVRDCGSA